MTHSGTARIVSAALALALLAGCGPAKHKAHHAAAPKAMTAAEGASICSDVAAWLPKAVNERYPRFTAKLEADVAKARGSKLGLDLAGLNSDLLSENAIALTNGPPGSPQNIQLVRSDCSSYGVTVPAG